MYYSKLSKTNCKLGVEKHVTSYFLQQIEAVTTELEIANSNGTFGKCAIMFSLVLSATFNTKYL